MESAAIKAYEIFKKHFSTEEAEIVMSWRDESLSKWVSSKEDLAKLESSLRNDIGLAREDMVRLESTLRSEISAVRKDMVKFEGSLREDMSKLEIKLAETQATMIKWFVGTSIALVGTVFALIKLVH